MNFLGRLLNRKDLLPTTRKKAVRRPIRKQLQLEQLEDRVVPANHVWVGGVAGGVWSNSSNWIGGAPTAAETGVNLYFSSNAQNTTTVDNINFVNPINNIFFTGDITGGGYDANSTPGGPLKAPAAIPNTANYTLSLSGVSQMELSANGITVGTAPPPNVAVSAGVVGTAVNSTDNINAAILMDPAATFITFKTAATDDLKLNGVVNDNGAIDGITKAGLGTVDLTVANTYLRGTNVTAGVLNITNSDALGTPNGGFQTTVSDGATLRLTGNLTIATGQPIQLGTGGGGVATLESFSGASSITDDVVLDDTAAPPASAKIQVDAGSTLTVNGIISSVAAADGLTVTGGGTLVLHGANTYDGNTTVTGAGTTLELESNTALGTPTAARLADLQAGTVLQLNGNLTINNTAFQENFQTEGATIENVAGISTIQGNLALNNAPLTTFQIDAGKLTMAGVISDAAGVNTLTKTGPGTLVFANFNTYIGVTNVNAGILQITNIHALGKNPVDDGGLGGGTNVAGGAILQVNVAGGGAINESVTLGTGAAAATLEQMDTGATVTDTYGGVLTLQNAASTVLVDRGSTVTTGIAAVPGDDIANFKGLITGSGNLVVNRSSGPATGGMMEMSGTISNTYSGSTTVLAGTLALDTQGFGVVSIPVGTSLNIGNPTASDVAALVFLGLPAGGGFQQNNMIDPSVAVTINVNGVLDLNSGAFSQTLPGLTMVGGMITSAASAGNLILTRDVNATSGSFVDNGVTIVQSAEIDFTNITWTGARTFNVAKGPAAVDLELSGSTSLGNGASAAALTKAGLGRMRIDGFGSYTGLTTVSAGILEAANGHALGNNPDEAPAGAGITVAANATLAIDADVTLGDGSKVLTLNGAGASGAGLGTVASPNPGALEGVGNQDDPAGTAAGYNGPIVLAGGGQDTIGADKSIKNALAFGSIGNTVSGTIPFYNDFETPDIAPTAAGAVTFPSVTLTLGGKISGAAGLTTVGGGTVVMAANSAVAALGTGGDNTYAGPTLVQWGTLELDQTQTLTPPGAPTVASVAIPTALTIGGAGFPATVRLDLSQEINQAVPVAISPKGTLDVQANTQTLNGGLTLTAGTLSGAGGTVILAAGTVNATSAAGVSSFITVTNLSLNGAETFNVTPGGAAVDLFVTSIIQDGTSAGSVTQLGGGILELTGANTFTGATSDSSGTMLLASFGGPSVPGALNISDAAGDTATVRQLVPNQTANTTAVSVLSANGTFDLNDLNDTIFSLSMTGGVVTLGNGAPAQAGTLTIANGPVTANSSASVAVITSGANHVLDFNGSTILFNILSAAGMIVSVPIQHGGLTKNGTGPLTLSGGGSYSGATTVNAGLLNVNGSQPSSPVTVNAGATLDGTGTVGNVVIASGGTLAPGSANAPGILNAAGSVTLQTGSTFKELINGTTPGAGYSQLNVAGPVIIQAGVTLNATINLAVPAGTQFTVIQATSPVNGTFSTVSAPGLSISYVGNTVLLTANVATTSTTVSAPPAAVFEQPVSLSATVVFASGTTNPGGSVIFFDNGVQIGAAQPVGPSYIGGAIHSSTVSIGVPGLAIGNHVITAIYSGDLNNQGSNNNTQVGGDTTLVSKAGTATTTPTVSTGASFFGNQVTVTASVTVNAPSSGSPVAPTGFITFVATNTGTLAQTTLGTQPLNGTQASVNVSNLPPGTYTFTATYNGDSNFLASPTSAASSAVTVSPAVSSISTPSATPNPVAFGSPVTFSTVVSNTSSSSAPVGSVDFFDGATDLGPATFVGTNANTATWSFTTSSLSVGTHSITAHFVANANFTNVNSAAVNEIVQSTVAAFVVKTDGSLASVVPGSGIVAVAESPGPGAVVQVSAVTDHGQAVAFALSAGNRNLWEHTASGWVELSPASFSSISAANDASGTAVVFGILTVNNPYGGAENLYEYHASSGGFTLTSNGLIGTVSAVGTPAGEVAYVTISTNNATFANTLWRYDAATGQFPEESSGSFATISTGLTAGGQAALYGVLTTGQLFEQNPAFGPISFNSGFQQLSGTGGLPASFLGVAAEAHAVDKVFAIAADRTIWEHTTSGNTQLSTLLHAAQLSAAQTPLGTDELFAVLTDGELWEFQAGPGASPAGFTQLLAGGVASTSAP